MGNIYYDSTAVQCTHPKNPSKLLEAPYVWLDASESYTLLMEVHTNIVLVQYNHLPATSASPPFGYYPAPHFPRRGPGSSSGTTAVRRNSSSPATSATIAPSSQIKLRINRLGILHQATCWRGFPREMRCKAGKYSAAMRGC